MAYDTVKIWDGTNLLGVTNNAVLTQIMGLTNGAIAAQVAGLTNNALLTQITGLTNRPLPVEQQFSIVNFSGITNSLIKSGTGLLHALHVNTPLAAGVITLYDNAGASGAQIAKVTYPGTLLSDQPTTVEYNGQFTTGLGIGIAGASGINVSVSYR